MHLAQRVSVDGRSSPLHTEAWRDTGLSMPLYGEMASAESEMANKKPCYAEKIFVENNYHLELVLIIC